MTHAYIYKILLPSEWAGLRAQKRFTGAPIDQQDGYIHLSTAAQVGETVSRHFRNADNILIAEIRSDRLGAALQYEVSRGGDLFPHLYADLTLDSVTRHWDLKPDANGEYDMPDFSL